MRLKGDMVGDVKKDNMSSQVYLNKKPFLRVHFMKSNPKARPEITALESHPQYTTAGVDALKLSLAAIPFRVQD